MKYYLYITGCDMNYSDAERIAAVFNEYGFSLANSEGEADVIVAVACSVREKAVHKIYGKVERWRKMGVPSVIVTGCVLPHDKKKFERKVGLVFGIEDVGLLSCYLVNLLNRKQKQDNKIARYQVDLEKKNGYLSLTPSYNSKFSANVPIMTGCDNFCSYCAVPYTRGREVSRLEEDVLSEIQSLVNAGYKEVTLLGQNVNSYGIKSQITNPNNQSNSKSKNKITKYQDNNLLENGKHSDFVNLLKKIDKIPGDQWFRFYANHPKDMSDELIDFLADSKHFARYIHLPLQSGDDEILKKMNRHYTAKKYLELVKKIRNKIPDVVLTTDIIVGFPTEDEKAFRNTVDVMKKSRFDMAFIAEYSPRSGTIASKMRDDVPHSEKERRKRFLNDQVLAKSILQNNEKLVGKKVKVLIGKKDKKGFYIAKTSGLKDVRIPVGAIHELPLQFGEFYNVKIVKANPWGLEGETV